MKVVIQRSKYSNVKIDNKIYNEIPKGLVVFSCFTGQDTLEDINYIVKKIINLRIFDDENGIMNKSILVNLLYMPKLIKVIALVILKL